MDSINKEINKLSVQNVFWIIFIIIGLFNIYADNLQKNYLKNGQVGEDVHAKKIFDITLIISLFIYIYILYQDYLSFKECNRNTNNSKIYGVKFLGSIFIVVGVLCSLYFQQSDKESIGDGFI